MPGGQVIQIQGVGDSWKDAIDIIEHAKQTGLRNQLLQLKLQEEARAAQMDAVKLQMMQQELQKGSLDIAEHKAEHPKVFEQKYRAEEADIAARKASTDYQEVRTKGEETEQAWAPVLKDQQQKEWLAKHEHDLSMNRWTSFEHDIKSSEILKERMDKLTTGHAVRDLGSTMFQQTNPSLFESNKKQVELYSEKMGIEGFQKLYDLSLQQNQQTEHNKILREQIAANTQYHEQILDQKRMTTIISAAKSPESLEALRIDPEFRDDPTIQNIAQMLRDKQYDADTKKAFLTAVANIPTITKTDANGLPVKQIDPSFMPTIMGMTEELLKRQDAKRANVSPTAKPSQTPAQQQGTSSKDNPIQLKGDGPEAASEAKQYPVGTYVRTKKGTVLVKQQDGTFAPA